MNEKKAKQIDKFRDAARQLETDEDEKRFDERLKRIAKSLKPKDDKQKGKDD